MEERVALYYELKSLQKEIERQLAELRNAILADCAEDGPAERTVGGYRVKIVTQDRREYDDNKLYEALPDASVWRLVSKADPSKIAALIKLNVISEAAVRNAYTVKKVALLHVERT